MPKYVHVDLYFCNVFAFLPQLMYLSQFRIDLKHFLGPLQPRARTRQAPIAERDTLLLIASLQELLFAVQLVHYTLCHDTFRISTRAILLDFRLFGRVNCLGRLFYCGLSLVQEKCD